MSQWLSSLPGSLALVPALFAMLLTSACGDDKTPDFECDCAANEVCREGVCQPASDTGGGGDLNNPDCPAAGLFLSEVMYAPSSGEPEYIEIGGPVGTDLSGFRLLGVNGNDGADAMNVGLTGSVGDSGFYLIASLELANSDQLAEDISLQNGPDSVQLLNCDGLVVDALGYGEFEGDEVFSGEGSPAPASGTGSSLGRCDAGDDTDDNSVDWHVMSTPTPGATNEVSSFADPFACAACDTSVTGVFLSEVMYAPSTGEPEFIELAGPVGADMSGFRLVGINGTNGDETMSLPLVGSIGADGLYLVAEVDITTDADLVSQEIDMQNGPDSVQLVNCDGSIVDALGYGVFEGEQVFAGEGVPSEVSGTGSSLGRCADADDTDDNSSDWHTMSTPTPGEPNTAISFEDPFACAACDSAGFSGVLISELLYNPGGSDTVDSEFVELAGPADLDAFGLFVEFVNGTDGEVYQRSALVGSFSSEGFYLLGGPLADSPLPGTIQNGPDGVRVIDCDDNVLDAVAYGNVADIGEGTAADTVADGFSLSRCPDLSDSGNNAADFYEAIATPDAENDEFSDPLACGGTGCGVGLHDGRLWINEIQPGADGFIELGGDPNLGISLVTITVLDADGVLLDTLTFTGSTDATGFAVVDTDDLDAAGGSIQLLDCQDLAIDQLAWGAGSDLQGEGSVAAVPSAGQSLARCPETSDSDDNGADFNLVDTPSPGAINSGFADAEACTIPTCTPGEAVGEVIINEVVYDQAPEGYEFIELLGPADLGLTGMVVELVNGTDGSNYGSFTIDSGTTGSDGFFVMGSPGDHPLPVTIQNGPDAIRLLDCDGETVLDLVGYGDFGDLEDPPFEGTTYAVDVVDAALARCDEAEDTDENVDDFFEDEPTPGAPNSPPACQFVGCDVDLTGLVLINEMMPNEEGGEDSLLSFVELRADLSGDAPVLTGATLSLIEGSSGSVRDFVLDQTLPANGYYVIGESDVPNVTQIVVMNLTNIRGNVVLTDCLGNRIDAVSYGAFDEDHTFEGETAAAPAGNDGDTIMRFLGSDFADADSDDNSADFCEVENVSAGDNAGLENTLEGSPGDGCL